MALGTEAGWVAVALLHCTERDKRQTYMRKSPSDSRSLGEGGFLETARASLLFHANRAPVRSAPFPPSLRRLSCPGCPVGSHCLLPDFSNPFPGLFSRQRHHGVHLFTCFLQRILRGPGSVSTCFLRSWSLARLSSQNPNMVARCVDCELLE